jgi:capsular polysaccharide biosynthesis protein
MASIREGFSHKGQGGLIVEETKSLKEILKILKKRILLLISIIIVSVSIAIVLSFYVLTPIYEAETQILVNQKANGEDPYSWSQIETDLQLINTYKKIIKSPFILSKVIEELSLDTTPQQLERQITLSSESDSKVVNILVESENLEAAVNIVNVTAEIFKEEIPKLMNVDNINILSSANLDENMTPIKPNKMLNIAMGVVIGIVIGIGLAFLIESLDTTIKDEKDVENVLGRPIIGLVASIPIKKRKKSSVKSHRMRGAQDVWVEK